MPASDLILLESPHPFSTAPHCSCSFLNTSKQVLNPQMKRFSHSLFIPGYIFPRVLIEGDEVNPSQSVFRKFSERLTHSLNKYLLITSN